jgi:hypothetical protein
MTRYRHLHFAHGGGVAGQLGLRCQTAPGLPTVSGPPGTRPFAPATAPVEIADDPDRF